MRNCHLITATSTHQVLCSVAFPPKFTRATVGRSHVPFIASPLHLLPPSNTRRPTLSRLFISSITAQWSPSYQPPPCAGRWSTLPSKSHSAFFHCTGPLLQQRTPMLPKQLGRSGSIFFIVALLESASFCLPFWSRCSFLRSF